MQPHPAFADLDVPGYADLLEVRLREFNQPEERRQLAAMDLFDRTLMRWQPASEWLPAFYGGLEPAAQTRLRRAVAELIDRVRPDQFPLQALVELLGLAGDIGAQQAVAPMLRLVADGGEWSLRRPGPMPTLLAVLKQLRPGGEVFDQLQRLLTSPAFQDHQVFDLFEILARARPEAWAASWIMLHRRFEQAQRLGPPAGQLGPEQWFERRTRDLCRRVLALLEPQTLRLGIDHLSARLGSTLAGQLAPHLPLGLLWQHLIAEEGSPFERRPEVDGWAMLCKRDAPEGSGVLWPDDWFDWDVQLERLSRPLHQRARLLEWESITIKATSPVAVLVQELLLQAKQMAELGLAA